MVPGARPNPQATPGPAWHHGMAQPPAQQAHSGYGVPHPFVATGYGVHPAPSPHAQQQPAYPPDQPYAQAVQPNAYQAHPTQPAHTTAPHYAPHPPSQHHQHLQQQPQQPKQQPQQSLHQQQQQPGAQGSRPSIMRPGPLRVPSGQPGVLLMSPTNTAGSNPGEIPISTPNWQATPSYPAIVPFPIQHPMMAAAPPPNPKYPVIKGPNAASHASMGTAGMQSLMPAPQPLPAHPPTLAPAAHPYLHSAPVSSSRASLLLSNEHPAPIAWPPGPMQAPMPPPASHPATFQSLGQPHPIGPPQSQPCGHLSPGSAHPPPGPTHPGFPPSQATRIGSPPRSWGVRLPAPLYAAPPPSHPQQPQHAQHVPQQPQQAQHVRHAPQRLTPNSPSLATHMQPGHAPSAHLGQARPPPAHGPMQGVSQGLGQGGASVSRPVRSGVMTAQKAPPGGLGGRGAGGRGLGGRGTGGGRKPAQPRCGPTPNNAMGAGVSGDLCLPHVYC